MALGLALVAALVAGCGPRYVPSAESSSAQAPTSCPDERELANRARENALNGGPVWKAALGSAVLLHARCEHQVLADMKLDADEQDALMAQFERARNQFYTARNLYSEVLGHRDDKLRTQAETGLEDLHELFSTKLRAVPSMRAEFLDVAIAVDQQRQSF